MENKKQDVVIANNYEEAKEIIFKYEFEDKKIILEKKQIDELLDKYPIIIYLGSKDYWTYDKLSDINIYNYNVIKYKDFMKKEKNESESILLEAEKILNGDRQADYSDAVTNFKRISECASLLTGKELTSEDCCKVMIAVKLMRERNKHKRDNLVDLCGYSDILNEIIESK